MCRRLELRILAMLLCSSITCGRAVAQNDSAGPLQAPSTEQNQSQATSSSPPSPSTEPTDASPDTLFPHSDTSRYWVSGQANVVFQAHPAFPAKYTGPNSLTPWAQSATTHVLTLFTGYQLTNTTEVLADAEYATGGGIGTAFGLAGYTNLDSVRTVSGAQLSTAPYLARLMVRQIIPLSSKTTGAERDEFHLATTVPVRRIEMRFGKFDLEDFFDQNTWGSDSHLQFLNWTIDANGAYDYAANTRGYTDGAMIEYYDHWFAARFGAVLEPKIANGIRLDADVARARSENLELEAHGKLIAHRRGAVRLLGYLNEADMGRYGEAIDKFKDHETPTPDIVSTRRQGRHRYGFGLSWEQEVTSTVGLFGRLGWSDGHNEAWAYTEDDRTAEIGAFSGGSPWHRPNDRAGTAFVANGIVASHQQYLALGGLGFLLGDGALTYGPEEIFEGFYTAHLWRGFFASFDLQHVNNPGYNQVRGPVTAPGLRFHAEF